MHRLHAKPNQYRPAPNGNCLCALPHQVRCWPLQLSLLYTCPNCSRCFATYQGLRNHQAMWCGKTPEERKLKKKRKSPPPITDEHRAHLRAAHRRRGHNPTKLQHHNSTKHQPRNPKQQHDRNSPYTCDKCNQEFITYQGLRNHQGRWCGKSTSERRWNQGKPRTREHRRKMSEAMTRRLQAGGKTYPHNAIPGRYNGIFMRSQTEIKVAQWLDRIGIAWQYEVRIPLGIHNYLPDFYLPEYGIFWEVKGYFREKDRKKMARVRALYPESKFVIIDKAMLQFLGIK